MSSTVFFAVILAALLHAIWNGMVKNFEDKVITVSAIVFGHVPMAILVMLFLPSPTLESIPYIILPNKHLTGLKIKTLITEFLILIFYILAHL